MNNNRRYLLYFLLLIPVLFLLWYFRSIVVYVLAAGVLSLVGRPLVRFLQKPVYKNLHLPGFLAALIYLLLVWAMFFGFFWLFVPVVVGEAKNLSAINVTELFQRLAAPVAHIQSVAARRFGIDSGDFSIQDFLTRQFTSILNMEKVSGIFSSLAGFIGTSVIAAFSVTFISFFLLKEKGLLNRLVSALVPEDMFPRVERALNSIQKLLRRYFTGLFFEVLGVSVLVSAGMLVTGLSLTQAMLIGLFAGILNIIPYLGPVIGICFGLFIGAVSHLQAGPIEALPVHLFWMFLVFLVVQFIDNWIFQPLIYAGSVHAHPLEIFLVILAGATVAGIPGMIVAVPVYTVLRVLAREFLSEFRIVQKLTRKL